MTNCPTQRRTDSAATWSVLIVFGLLVGASGCATPDYLLPGGYSSTYHKALTQPAPLHPPASSPLPPNMMSPH